MSRVYVATDGTITAVRIRGRIDVLYDLHSRTFVLDAPRDEDDGVVVDSRLAFQIVHTMVCKPSGRDRNANLSD